MIPLAESNIDDVVIKFSDTSLLILGLVIAIIMFGIALDTEVADFKSVLKLPKAMAVGIAAQFIALPAITFGLSILLGVQASIAMGMILVACCPPGAISNVLTYRSRGNVALSVSMTAISNLLAIFLMPLNIAFWGGIHPEASKILEAVNLSALELLAEVVLVIGLPFVLGIFIQHHRKEFADRVVPHVKRFSFIALVAFVLIAYVSNFNAFKDHILVVAIAVFLHDTLALLLGYGIASSFRLDEYNRRAITFEVGVRNAGLGLGIVFTFFDGIGGMAMVAGWWGMWDIIAGLVLSSWWARRSTGHDAEAAPSG